MSIAGKVVLVTGAGQGIGRAIALRLAKDGGDIAIVDVDESKMKAVADEVMAIGRKATTFKANVAERDDVYAAVDHVEKKLGGFDVIVNNAGIAQETGRSVPPSGVHPASAYRSTLRGMPNPPPLVEKPLCRSRSVRYLSAWLRSWQSGEGK